MNWKIILRSLGHKDMRGRILAVLGILLVFRILAHLPVPLGNAATLHQVLQNLFNSSNTPQLLSFINVLSGGALANFSIMIAGMGPYINASIIMQLLTKAIPQLEALHKEGEFGQKKINQYTRLLTFPLAIIQSIGSIYLIRQAAQSIGGIGDITANASLMQWVLMVGALTGGSMLLMWLGELVTEQSIGNGISLIITVGIVSRLPSNISTIIGTVAKGNHMKVFGETLPFNRLALIYGVVTILSIVIVTWLVVMLNEAARNLTVNYAKRVQGNRAYGGITTMLPVKLITAGVVPIIFAVAFLSVPSFVGQLLSGGHNAHLASIGTNLVTLFQTPSATTFATEGYKAYIYPVTYFLLVFIFTFFYTSITFNSKEIAENLHKQGGFIENVRSGLQTEKYLSKIVNRLTFFGAFSLGILAILPIIAQLFVNTSITIGGTSVLILVSVALQTLRAVESRALMVTYDQYSQPDFFYETDDDPLAAGTNSRRFKFLPTFRKPKAKS
jgi:preprotein translocase subunit SecY